MTEMTTVYVTDRDRATFRWSVPTQLAHFPLDEPQPEAVLEELEPEARAALVVAKIRCLKEANQ
jgi:hypothetical protein